MSYSSIHRALEEYLRKPIMRVDRQYDRLAVLVQFGDGNMISVDERFVRELESRYRKTELQAYCQPNNYVTVNSDYADAMQYEYQSKYAFQQMYGMQVFPSPSQSQSRKCSSCGGSHPSETLDRHGFCKKNQDKFWSKVRKLYWHRYTKNEQVLQH